ncbi:MAG: hypothetical protein B0D96_13110 [Candidatus Sedimenticola endophacoides]|uniref:Sensor protein FixL n=1 Tax=Candidatus Sedimenticola endophacoides TaxID=2548426 RepID=A0A6N4DX54_9GAMM|nr:MAG: hypothetical protein B0D96_13110 [Candidatus Sedimenticola endophacoides]OQX42765.1 MAG: hypothetical protein B0D89_00575 [Candidatus Sedimenticola endophacoides]PUD98092.1 MAG: hypothetical protein C3L26_13700 [Candidatus Sedimenticola endophacoides]PUE00543.1 MAG: hypothetical protein C3L25_13605 [Candidatus Sedimenticola endophacoides]PUE02811.1 MAG: hypothetical protein C3L24_05510 [Candidatus Sedimenticola endophacoides]
MPRSLKTLIARLVELLGVRQTLALLLAVISIVGGALGVTSLVERRYQSNLANNLQTVLHSADQAMKIWAREHYQSAANFAATVTLREAARDLLKAPREPGALLATPAQARLREFFAPNLKNGQYRGFFLIAPDGVSLASSRDRNVATPNLLLEQPDVLERLWRGETVISRIQPSDVPLYDDADAKRHATLFVGAPVRDGGGGIIALLTLRIDPHRSLFPLMRQGRLGETGETYMFDPQGLMLNDSRFVEQLTEIGMLQRDAAHLHGDDGEDFHAHLEIFLHDPGEDLRETRKIPLGLSAHPLTRMAASATTGESGIDLEGYRDYRGVPVVGVWLWDREFNIGLTTEQDLEEAYALFHFVRWLIYGGAATTLLILLLLTWNHARGQRLLRVSRSRLSAVVDNAIDCIVVIDSRGVIESVNPATLHLFGYSRRELVGQNIRMLMPEPHASRHDGYLRHYLHSGEARIIGIGRELEARRADGSLFPIELGVSRLDYGDEPHFSGTIRDITVRKEFELALENERLFSREVLDSLTAHIAVLDAQGTIVMTNQAWEDFGRANGLEAGAGGVGLGYLAAAEAASGDDAEAAGRVVSELRKMLEGVSEGFELEYPCHSPRIPRWFQMRASRFLHNGRPAIVVSHLNITQRILSEQQLRTMSLVARNTDNAVIVTDLRGGITWVNEGFSRMSGYLPAEVLGRTPGELLWGSDTDDQVVGRIGDALSAGERIEGELLNYAKSGRPYWIHFEISPVTDEQGRIIEFVALEQDITEQRRMLEALRQEKEATEVANIQLNLTREALERTGIGEFWISARDGRILRVNDHGCEHLGYSREELLTLQAPDFDIRITPEHFREFTAPIKEAGWKRFESVHQTRDGRRIPVEITAIYLSEFGEYGEMFISFVSDITQRKEAEIELILARDEAEQASRAKSTFLATMSHEIRTPLNGVVGTVDMLSHTPLDDSQRDLVATAKDSAVLLQGIIDDILDFSKIEAGRLELARMFHKPLGDHKYRTTRLGY